MDGFLRRYRRQHLLACSKFGANFSICTYGRATLYPAELWVLAA
jgi:hypothetical protein